MLRFALLTVCLKKSLTYVKSSKCMKNGEIFVDTCIKKRKDCKVSYFRFKKRDINVRDNKRGYVLKSHHKL